MVKGKTELLVPDVVGVKCVVRRRRNLHGQIGHMDLKGLNLYRALDDGFYVHISYISRHNELGAGERHLPRGLSPNSVPQRPSEPISIIRRTY